MDWFLYDNGLRHERVNDTHMEKMYFTQFRIEAFTETVVWLLLTFFIYTINYC